MNVTNQIRSAVTALALSSVGVAACNKATPPPPPPPVAPAPAQPANSLAGFFHAVGTVAAVANALSGGGDTCAEARMINVPGTIVGDLTNAHDDSNGRIEVTGYSWSGRDQFFAMDLHAGQVVSVRLDDHGGFDGGMYVFRNCADIPGSVVTGLDSSAGGPPMTFTAPADGRYYLAVDAWVANTGGPYTVSTTPGA